MKLMHWGRVIDVSTYSILFRNHRSQLLLGPAGEVLCLKALHPEVVGQPRDYYTDMSRWRVAVFKRWPTKRSLLEARQWLYDHGVSIEEVERLIPEPPL